MSDLPSALHMGSISPHGQKKLRAPKWHRAQELWRKVAERVL